MHSNKTFWQYDSGNITVIDEHINDLSNAGIDYVLFDFTNHIETWWITRRG